MMDHAPAPAVLPHASPTPTELLLVDDDPVFGRVLTTALGRRGFHVTLADSVTQARGLLSDLRVSHAVLDLRLPDGSGLELLPLLRERLPQMRIVVLSGYANIPTAIDAIKLGATYYLAKPVDADAVVRAFDAGDAALPAISPLPETAPSVRRVEWEHIQRVLKDCNGNVSAAARALRMHRRTMQRKLGKRSGSL
ncbi:response regulator transcription factor [Immundisolibacter sp.]